MTVHRGRAATELASSLDARSFTHGGEIYLPDAHGPLSSGTGRSLLAHELTHVVQQRRLGSGLPAERSPSGQRLEAEAVAAERSGGLPLAVPPRIDHHGAGESIAAPSPAAQRSPSTDHGPTAHGTTTVNLATFQRAPSDRSEPMPRPEAGRGGHRDHTEEELEDLAHQLYARIGRRLRRELLVDRERAGLALDVR